MSFAKALALPFVCFICLCATAAEPTDWIIQPDYSTGGLIQIANKNAPHMENWLREAGHWQDRQWTSDKSPGAKPAFQWGLVETKSTGLLHVAQVMQHSERSWEAVYTAPVLTVTVKRQLNPDGTLQESYTFTNTGLLALDFPVGSVSIYAPLFDQYPDAATSLTSRCHVHIWAGGSSAWINAMQMSGHSPHLGMVMTEGSIAAYSQRGTTLSDRGVFLLHPAAMKIDGGKSVTLSWRLFWHEGWDDFFKKALAQPGFVQLTAKKYTVPAGESLEITGTSNNPFQNPQLTANGKVIAIKIEGKTFHASIKTIEPGEIKVELIDGAKTTWLSANVTAPAEAIVDARVRFIVRHQQRRAPGDPLDGAYLAYDNETETQVYAAKPSDHNAGRERVGMGVLGALFLPRCKDETFKTELEESLSRYNAFITRELEDEQGNVYGSVGRTSPERLYNFAWVARFHLAMYEATKERDHLQRYVRIIERYYARGGSRFYAIGIPVTEGLQALTDAKEDRLREKLLTLFREHAGVLLKNGTNYPISEVNYEQSIVAPAVEMLLEVYLATHDTKYLDGAKQQMPLLEGFAGRQPDHRLHEVPIRHWDDYWFGKLNLYGDTFPHYWSTENAVAYALMARATGEDFWRDRADTVLRANLSLFSPDGRGSAAHVYPLTCDGVPAARNDPWANDQDWALVNLLRLQSK
ncbi:MAG: hypothetical protein QM790_14240 [Nibricoccus sp.]